MRVESEGERFNRFYGNIEREERDVRYSYNYFEKKKNIRINIDYRLEFGN